MTHLPQPHSGYTLVELLVSLTIITMVVTAFTGVFSQGIKHTRLINGESELIEAASSLTQTAAHEVRQATALSLVSDSELVVTQTDFSTHTLQLVGTEVQLNGTSVLDPDLVVSTLRFVQIEDTIQLNFTIEADTGTNPSFIAQPLSATTTIAMRNKL